MTNTDLNLWILSHNAMHKKYGAGVSGATAQVTALEIIKKVKQILGITPL